MGLDTASDGCLESRAARAQRKSHRRAGRKRQVAAVAASSDRGLLVCCKQVAWCKLWDWDACRGAAGLRESMMAPELPGEVLKQGVQASVPGRGLLVAGRLLLTLGPVMFTAWPPRCCLRPIALASGLCL